MIFDMKKISIVTYSISHQFDKQGDKYHLGGVQSSSTSVALYHGTGH